MFIPPFFLLLRLGFHDVRALLRDSTFLLPVRHAATSWTIIETATSWTISESNFLYRTGIWDSKKVAMAWIEPLSKYTILYGIQKSFLWHGSTPAKSALCYHLLTNWVSRFTMLALIFIINISTVPSTSSSSFCYFSLSVFFLPAVFTIIFMIHKHGCNPSKASHFYI